MTTRSVCMAVLNLLNCGITHIYHFDIEVQSFTGQLMVAVDAHHVRLHIDNAENPRSLGRVRLEPHSHLDFVGIFEPVTRNILNKRRIVLAKTISWQHRDRNLVALGLPFERHFQTGDDIAGPVEVSKRIAVFRRIEHVTRIVAKAIVDCGDVVLRDLHIQTSLVEFVKKRPVVQARARGRRMQ